MLKTLTKQQVLKHNYFISSVDKQLRELIEDAYAFTTSFVASSVHLQDQDMEDLSQPLNNSPSKQLKAQEDSKLKALKKYAVDVQSLNKFYSRLEQSFESEEA